MNEIIKVENVDLIYQSAESLSIKKALKIIFHYKNESLLKRYKALSNISFSIEKGKVYGIIGNNGAGKSTLLRILSGVMSPYSGTVTRNYKTINLLALGVGFSKEISGYDNIFLNGMLLGFTRKQINEKLQEIIEYSELGEFIYKPMKTYSSGMVSRLGFSIAINLKPEVLLIDEILSVGDIKFREKSFNSIKNIIKDKSITVVIVSHSLSQIEDLCDYVIWLDKGNLILKGNTIDVLEMYKQYNNNQITIAEIIRDKNTDKITVKDNSFTVDYSKYNLNLADSEEKVFLNRTFDYIKNFNINNCNLKVTKRKLDNGDDFLYFEFENLKDINVILKLDEILEFHRFEKLYKKPSFNNRYGENKVSGLNGYYNLKTGSLFISKIYYYKILEHKYENNEKSTLTEFISETNNIKQTDKNTINISIKENKTKNTKASFFILISKSKLFRNIENLENYMEYYYDSIFNNSVWCSYFMVPACTYTKLPYSIEPFTKDGYGFSLQHSSKKDLFPFYFQTNERFFYNMIVNAVLQTYMYQQNENYVFFTPYTSTWLKKDTGITAPYIDTRLNETFILMEKDFFAQTKIFSEIDPEKNYIEFLYSYYKKGEGMYKLGNGIFFPDYFKNGLPKITHASLNHQLGTAAMFLNAYDKYKEKRYLNVFNAIIEFIKNSHNHWINKETGDLYYGIKINKDSQYEYYDKDYVYVTLLDLLILQTAYIKILKCDKNKVLENLMNAKINYLRQTEYDIFNPNAKNAPGEKIDSRKQALKLYNNLYDK